MNEDLEIELLLRKRRAGTIERPYVQVNRNERSLRAKLAHNAAETILSKRTNHSGGIAEFGGLKCGAQDHQNFAFRHRHIQWAEVEEGVAEGEHFLAIVISHGAHSSSRHIARTALDGRDSHLREERRERADSLSGESGEHQRSVDGHHHWG